MKTIANKKTINDYKEFIIGLSLALSLAVIVVYNALHHGVASV